MEPRNNLTREEAARRAATASRVRYEIALDLSEPGSDTYRCEALIRFDSPEPGAATFLDYLAPGVDSATLNGAELGADAFDGTRIRLPELASENEVRIVGRSRFEHTGVGMHRFRDPVDDHVYLYTDFEPFDAHHVYPCFDQPDLKGEFTFSVVAPAEWRVVSNMALALSEDLGGGLTRSVFLPTPPISTYVSAVVAGPYHEERREHGRLDLGVLCRQSMARHLDADEFLELTAQGFDFFEKTFDYPYPFGEKYDQVVVPEFNSGAMENAGCITFNESYIFRSKVTQAARQRRAETILHEMAHMWFGDLVTMTWWDDLWLNESFATFASVLALTRATRFTNGWTAFANDEKTWAYQQDQLPTTHPITADMPDTNSVHNNFDGITYAKGASVLRQLAAWVGEDAFLEGLRIYFRRHEFSNTDLSGFLSALEEASDRDLHAWSKEWLETAGLNTLRPAIETGGDSITSFAIEQQAPPEQPVLRSHRLGIGLYDLDGGELKRRRFLETDVLGSRTQISDLEGEPMADLVLPNDDDLAYAKIRLDARSLQTAIDSLGRLRDPLSRTLCWSAYWDMVRDAEAPTRDYLQLVLRNAQAEDDVGVVQRLLGQVTAAIDLYGDPSNRTAAHEALAAGTREVANGAEPGSDLQLAWTRAFIGTATTAEHLDEVRGILTGETEVEGLTVDVDLRWHIVISLASVGAVGEEVIAAELERDATDAGRRHAATARAARREPGAKAEAWRSITEDATLSVATLSALMRGFQQPGQRELLEPYAPRYFEALDPIWNDRDFEVALAFAGGMYPRLRVDESTVALTESHLDSNDVPGPITRILVEAMDGVRRALRAREADRAAA